MTSESTKMVSRARRDYVEDTKALLHLRFREKLRIEDIARALYVSPFHLCRLFKEATGVSIHTYLNRLRLRQALAELARGEVHLTTLALELGYSCHSHFTNVFRKEFGMPPRDVLGAAGSGRLAEMEKALFAPCG